MKAGRLRIAALAVLLSASALAAPRHVALLREAAEAVKTGDEPTALGKLQEAARLRPDYPRIQVNLARAYASLQRPDEALACLQRLADMGVRLNLAADPGLAPLRDLPRFQSLAAPIATGPASLPATDEAAFAITAVTGIIESCLVDPETLEWYFGDVRNRCIWKREVSSGLGLLKQFTAGSDQWDGVFKIALSPDRKTLWAATATVSAMTGTDAEDGKRSALVALDFATGRVRARFPAPADGRKHLLGDFVIAADGSLYATDSFSPVIWRLPPGGDHLEPWLGSDEFLNLQGLAFSADGRTLFVSDYSNGIWRINAATKSIALLTAPPNATFFGIDGLYAVPGGLLAVQNGVNPQRVLRLEPAAEGVVSPARVVASGRPDMTDLALGTVFNGRFHFVGDSGWSLFDPPPATPPPARTVTIYSVSTD